MTNQFQSMLALKVVLSFVRIVNNMNNFSESSKGKNNSTLKQPSDDVSPKVQENKRKDKELAMVLNMEKQLKEMIVGQDDVIQKICKVIQLSKAGLRFHDRPIGVFFLLGPTVSFPNYFLCS
jgi:ATP-dependent Clp protease ATP-binding subunit ClpA